MKQAAVASSSGLPDWRHLMGFEAETQSWSALIAESRMPPVLLLVGRAGLGKSLLLAKLAALYQCRLGNGCGACDACRWLLTDSHPEVLWIEAAQGKLVLDDAARLQDHLALSPGPGVRARVVAIVDADQLSPQAANRLLKTLEEPPPSTTILMSTSRVHNMLPTVLSRCVRWRVVPPPVAQTRAWLEAQLEEQLRTGLSQQAVDRALKVAGFAPGMALTILKGEDSLNEELSERIAGALKGRRLTPDQALAMAETLSKESGLSLGELIELYERSLNTAYWQWSEQTTLPPPAALSLWERRERLRHMKRLALKGRVAVNSQLAMEALALTAQP